MLTGCPLLSTGNSACVLESFCSRDRLAHGRGHRRRPRAEVAPPRRDCGEPPPWPLNQPVQRAGSAMRQRRAAGHIRPGCSRHLLRKPAGSGQLRSSGSGLRRRPPRPLPGPRRPGHRRRCQLRRGAQSLSWPNIPGMGSCLQRRGALDGVRFPQLSESFGVLEGGIQGLRLFSSNFAVGEFADKRSRHDSQTPHRAAPSLSASRVAVLPGMWAHDTPHWCLKVGDGLLCCGGSRKTASTHLPRARPARRF